MTEPTPTVTSGNASATRRIASIAVAVRNVISSSGTPPSRSAAAIGTIGAFTLPYVTRRVQVGALVVLGGVGLIASIWIPDRLASASVAHVDASVPGPESK